MDPISLGLGVVGLGMQIFGGMGQSKIAGQTAAYSADIASQEQSINAQKQIQMGLQARRSQLENVRNAQRARATATAAATSQGAQFGSGLQGGLAGVTDQATTNALGINQNFEIGSNIAGYNNNISSDKMNIAALGGQSATDAGMASLGGALMKSGPIIGGFGKDAMSGISGLSDLANANFSGGLGHG